MKYGICKSNRNENVTTHTYRVHSKDEPYHSQFTTLPCVEKPSFQNGHCLKKCAEGRFGHRHNCQMHAKDHALGGIPCLCLFGPQGLKLQSQSQSAQWKNV